MQLWHVGRVSHFKLQPDGDKPVSSTDATAATKVYVDDSFARVDASEPRMLRTEEVPGIVEEFARGARNAKAAGFDGVEIHGANSYLLDQFVRDGVNKRDDIYGGPLENRLRFPLAVAEAVVGVWSDAGRVGYRISPLSEHKDVRDSDPGRTFSMLARGLGGLGLAYLHAVETWDRSTIDPRVGTVLPQIVEAFKDAGGGVYVANGDYSPEAGEKAVEQGWADAIAFGKLWIPNPDLAARIERGGPYRAWDQASFYGGGSEGYSDYEPLGVSVGRD